MVGIRDFVADARNHQVSEKLSVPIVHVRESRVGEASAIRRHLQVSLLSRDEVRSQEEECKYSTGRLGVGRQAHQLVSNAVQETRRACDGMQSVVSGLKPPLVVRR